MNLFINQNSRDCFPFLFTLSIGVIGFLINCSGDGNEPNIPPSTDFSSSSATPVECPSFNPETHFCDSRNGNVYKWVEIGEQKWMAENLNYAVTSSKCYGEEGKVDDYYDEEKDEHIYITLTVAQIQANCGKYGRLYNWNTAVSICPEGWHLPATEDWDELAFYVYGEACPEGWKNGCGNGNVLVGNNLKAKSGWNDDENGESGNGLDTYGFSALPGGLGASYYGNGQYDGAGYTGYWWTANEENSYEAYFAYITHDGFKGYSDGKFMGLSVRCIKDEKEFTP